MDEAAPPEATTPQYLQVAQDGKRRATFSLEDVRKWTQGLLMNGVGDLAEVEIDASIGNKGFQVVATLGDYVLVSDYTTSHYLLVNLGTPTTDDEDGYPFVRFKAQPANESHVLPQAATALSHLVRSKKTV